MCDSSFEEDLERYRRNNVELAVALNELKADLNTIQVELLQRNRELQRAHAENAGLKLELSQKDNQLKTWRLLIMDLVQTNTQKYAELMKKVGLTSATNGPVNRPSECPPCPPVKAAEQPLPTTSKPAEKTNRTNTAQRRPKDDDNDFKLQLSDLKEESIASQLNESKSSESSPDKNVNHVVSRRRASVPPMTPSTPPLTNRQNNERMVSNGETNGRKPAARAKHMDKIIDENTPVNGAMGRPTRKTAPRNLSEPKLSTKLRRT